MRRGREIVATLLIAFGLFSLLSVYTTLTGQAGAFIALHLNEWLGFAAGLPGLFLAWVGVVLWRRLPDRRSARRFAGFLALFVSILIVLHLGGRVTSWPSVWAPSVEMTVHGALGGRIGGLLAGASMKLLGPLGTGLGLIVLLVIGWVMLVDVSPARLLAAWKAGLSRRRGGEADGAEEDELADEPKLGGFLARWKQRRQTVKETAASDTGPRRTRSRRRKRDNSGVKGGAAAFALDDGTDSDSEEDPAPPSRRQPAAAPTAARREVRSDARSDASRRTSGDYTLPPVRLLERPQAKRRNRTAAADDGRSELLEETLASFGIEGKVVSVSRGPTVTRYEVQPPPGIKVSRIVGLADDLALALAATGVRIEAPVPGKSVVGIEVPNKHTSPVVLREILESDEFQKSRSKLTVGLGRDIAGKPLVADLQKLLHLLIAGATGSGKSVCLNSIITSLLYKADPEEVKLMMIDPKRVELSVYDGIPHLITPVVTDPKEAAGALRWAVKEMERRYQLLSKTGVRNLDAYNRRRRKPEGLDEFVPYLVVIIDELADLMLVASADVENSVVRLAQMARAAGIYLIIATQRPSVDVITGLIKANVPSRLAFAVSSQVDSRTILDMGGAERLLGRGDMLFHPIGAPKPVRAQGTWVSDTEVEAVAEAWREQGEPEYIEEVIETPPTEAEEGADAQDELFDDAVALVREQGHASVSMLQRRFRIGYARAARLIDVMEVQGIVGPYQGSRPREVIGIDGAIRTS